MNYKRRAILMVGAVLCLNLSVYSQLISLKMNDVSVKKAMMELQTKSGFSFVYIAGDLDIRKMVTIDANQLDEAINQILKGQNVSYEIQGKNIVIKRIQRYLLVTLLFSHKKAFQYYEQPQNNLHLVTQHHDCILQNFVDK